jgi:hypothetical protein
MIIKSVKQYNIEANVRYKEKVDKFEFGQGGFPFRPMYVFQTPEGEDRQRGFVVSDGDSHKFYLTRKEMYSNV